MPHQTEEIRPVNEAKMRARWKLGQLLAKMERGTGPGRGKKKGGVRPSFMDYIKKIGLANTAAKEAQRISTLPPNELEKAFAEARKHDILNTYEDLIDRARPYWYKASRSGFTKARRRLLRARSDNPAGTREDQTEHNLKSTLAVLKESRII